jgi:hypothetical protein
MRTRLVFPLATAVAFLLATLWWTRPLLPALGTSYLGPVKDPTLLGRSDSMLTSWMLAWSAHALRTNPFGLFHANIFHPLPWTLAFSENLLAGALLVLPVDLAFGNPVLDHSVLVLASFVLGGLGTALLVRELGGGVAGAWLAGVIFAFNPLRFWSLSHVQVLSSHWMPFALLALHRCLRTGRGAALVAVTVVLVAWSSVYYAYFFWIALAVFVPLHWWLGCPAAPGARRRVLVALAVAAAGTALVLVPYAIARDVSRSRGARARRGSWREGHHVPGRRRSGRRVTQRYVRTRTRRWCWPRDAAAHGARRPRRRRARTAAGGVVCYLIVAVVLALVSLGPMPSGRRSEPVVPGPWPCSPRWCPVSRRCAS